MSSPAPDLHQLTALVYRLAGDHAELARRVTGLEDRVEDHTVVLDEIEAAAAALTAPDAAPPATGPDGPQEDVLDLRRLVDWVHANVAELLERRVPQTGGYPYWCRSWWLHAEAIARFEAARRCWEEAVAAGPGSAMVIYYEHLDHQLGVLCADHGPFSGCTAGVHTAQSPAQPLGQDNPPPSYFTGFDLSPQDPV